MGLSVVAGLALAVLAAPAPARALNWHRCAGARTWQCATATVPAGDANGSAGTLGLAVTRHRARRPGRHRHAVFLNYGGPGAGAVAQTHTDARFLLGPAFRRLDVVPSTRAAPARADRRSTATSTRRPAAYTGSRSRGRPRRTRSG